MIMRPLAPSFSEQINFLLERTSYVVEAFLFANKPALTEIKRVLLC
jgi:hypothetical protein